MSGNAKKGFKACRKDICKDRHCIWCTALKPSGGSNDLCISLSFFLISMVITVIIFSTIGAVVGIVILTIAFAKLVRRHRKLMKRRLRVKDYIVQDLSLYEDADDTDERQTLTSGTSSSSNTKNRPPPPVSARFKRLQKMKLRGDEKKTQVRLELSEFSQ
jgi:hypothetical protein